MALRVIHENYLYFVPDMNSYLRIVFIVLRTLPFYYKAIIRQKQKAYT